jgi:hypothetical protein
MVGNEILTGKKGFSEALATLDASDYLVESLRRRERDLPGLGMRFGFTNGGCLLLADALFHWSRGRLRYAVAFSRSGLPQAVGIVQPTPWADVVLDVDGLCLLSTYEQRVRNRTGLIVAVEYIGTGASADFRRMVRHQGLSELWGQAIEVDLGLYAEWQAKLMGSLSREEPASLMLSPIDGQPGVRMVAMKSAQ